MVLLGALLSGAPDAAAPPAWMHAAASQGAAPADTALCISGELRMEEDILGKTYSWPNQPADIARYFNLANGKTDVFVFAQWATTDKNSRNAVTTPVQRPSTLQKRCMDTLKPWTRMWGEYHWPSMSDPGVTEAANASPAQKQSTVRPCGDWNGSAIGTEQRCVTGCRGLPQYWSMSQCFRMVQQFERLTGVKYKWLIRARADSYSMGDHSMHPRAEWEQRLPAGTVLVNALHANSHPGVKETCRVDATTGAVYKNFGCTSLVDRLWCTRWWFNETVGLDAKLALRQMFSIPSGFSIPYESKRELMRHDLEQAGKQALQTTYRPSDKFAMGRRDDMAVYFSTIQSYVHGREFRSAKYLFSSACCGLLNSAEGRLCYQLTGHSTKFALMYPDLNMSSHLDFF
jgi:hypothetical protein